MSSGRRSRVFRPTFNYEPPKWLPIPNVYRRLQERRSRWPPFRENVTQDILRVYKLDLLLVENGAAHHSSKYDLMLPKKNFSPSLVVRRGQEFSLKIHFNRPYQKDTDGISFVFSVLDGKPSLAHGTLVLVPLLSKGSLLFTRAPSWSAYILEIEDNWIKIALTTSSSTSVGKWKLAVDTKRRDGQHGISYPVENPIYILFNPWNPDDEVYMEDDALRHETVIEDTGLIWRGTHASLRPTPWAYSQFEANVLDAALLVLGLKGPAPLSPSGRADPVKVARAISAAVNSPDDNGVVEGNWTEKFDGGMPPTKWTGSGKILQKYYATKKPVKFGQCWVFAGVVTSICRTLGLPCRPVTNYQSAHDTQSSVTVDYFLDDDGKPIEHLNTDSVWNFHVWNEVWMARPDLGEDSSSSSGWQVIDATPQEKSDELFRCGPASVFAVRRGVIRPPYDAGFVFSEVNSDKVYWHYRGPKRPMKLLGKKQDVIGLKISTKAVGEFEREDITHTYKYPEKTSQEREVMMEALRASESLFSRYYLNEDFNDVRFELLLRDDIVIGSSFAVSLIVRNVNKEKEYNVSASLRVDAMLYTGKVKAEIKREILLVKILPETEEEISMEVSYEDYGAKLCDQCDFNTAVLASVEETDYEYFANDDFRVRKPDIKFDIRQEDNLIVGHVFKGTAKLRNPLPIPLSQCQFVIDGPGLLDEPLKFKVKEKIEAGESAEVDFQLTPKLPGEKTISAKFTSKQLQDVDGFVKIYVRNSNEIPED